MQSLAPRSLPGQQCSARCPISWQESHTARDSAQEGATGSFKLGTFVDPAPGTSSLDSHCILPPPTHLGDPELVIGIVSEGGLETVPRQDILKPTWLLVDTPQGPQGRLNPI